MKRRVVFGLVLSIYLSVFSQDKLTIKSIYYKSEVPTLIFKPNGYDAQKKYPLVYLLHGYSENYTQWSRTIDCQSIANKYNMILVCPEGFTSYYIDSPYNTDLGYESFFFDELVLRIHKELSIDENNVFITGLSMGGYGALRYFILHPEYFNTAGSTSGAIDIDYSLFKKVSLDFWNSTRMTDDLEKIIGNRTDWADYSIIALMEKYDFRKPFIFDCGTEDILYQSSAKLKDYIKKEDIPATFISQPGNHNTDYWHSSIEYHFVYFQQHLK